MHHNMARRSRLFQILFFVLPVFLFVIFPNRAAGFVAERIMAIVNNEVIALSDVRKYGTLFGNSGEADQKAVLDEIIAQKVFLAEARKTGVAPPTGEEVREAYTKLNSDFGGAEEFGLVKKRFGLSEDEIQHLLRTRLHIEKLIDQRIRSFVFVTPRDVQAYLEANPGMFSYLSEDERKKSVEGAVRKAKSREKVENFLERLKSRSDIQVIFPP